MEIIALAVQAANVLVPDCVGKAVKAFGDSTGLLWGPSSAQQFWFQSPKEHVFQYLLALIVVALFYSVSKNFRVNAKAALSAKGAGWSTKCPINTLIAYILLGCFLLQVYVKGSRSQPFIQLGWLLMPCHLTTLTWVYIFLHDKPQHYGRNCYLASLLIDWFWAPISAVIAPDWSDHKFAFEPTVFYVHHGLLLLLPWYYAIRYHTMPLSRSHLLHSMWVPMLISFGLFTPYALLTGLNVNYMLYPPPLKGLPAVFTSPFYRFPFVAVQSILNVFDNLIIRGVADVFCWVMNGMKRAKRKVA
ncbi:TMEM164 family protein [Angomonas deanei]|uniref:TMEM164 family, putative n=1 Tax=Angomonas deanei TaxID=59799 RepID=S9VJV0_9TRYP|nr:TMEM164 family protein [Angomonas deanei]EPY41113.1 TMEM164 family protein [Angomonas deanei]CAD2221971.1 TMEM164 family, putative [Angomonas deanei]|eukprot:EPY39316.1 TMEM164 family protein [Angomonas deanei]